jgi:hypothetical protein
MILFHIFIDALAATKQSIRFLPVEIRVVRSSTSLPELSLPVYPFARHIASNVINKDLANKKPHSWRLFEL